uniref:Uncharacterized protein n=1 Tax=Rhizophora mucronata TaxID=61149 RepID=A0A2P2PXF4_RHIMU
MDLILNQFHRFGVFDYPHHVSLQPFGVSFFGVV